jgi:hypothetical protein
LSPESGAIIAGFVVASLVGLVYAAPVAYAWRSGRRTPIQFPSLKVNVLKIAKGEFLEAL